MKYSVGFAVSLLTLQQLTFSAFAADDSRVEELLRKLRSALASENSAAATPSVTTQSRSAKIRVFGIIHKKSVFQKPLSCEVFISSFNPDLSIDFSDQGSKPVVFNGNTGTCDVTVPFTWQFADIEGEVNVGVRISTEESPSATDGIDRSSDFNFFDIAMPAQGTTRTLGFEIDM